MMVIAVGLSSYNVALFHLVNHAFYKALLFLGAGSVIHAWADNQDFRKYGGLRAYLPLTYSVMLIASLSLVAFPFMTGFYSKDLILESAYGHFSFSSIVVYIIATIGAMFTTLYSVKVLYLTFLTNPNGPLLNYKKAHEGDIFMSMPLIVLAIFSIFFGYLTKDLFIGLGSSFFSDNSLFIHPRHEIMLDTEFAVSSAFKLLPLVLTIALSLISLLFSEFIPSALIHFKFSRLGYNVFSFFNQRFLIELFYNKYLTGFIFKLGGQTTKVLDKGSVELIGPFGLEKTLLNVSRNIAGLDSGVITSYALYILIALVIYMLIPYFSVINNSMFLLIVLALYVSLNNINNKSSKQLEWGLNSPYIPHSFVSLPQQSTNFIWLFTSIKLFYINLLGLFFYINMFICFINLMCLMFGIYSLHSSLDHMLCVLPENSGQEQHIDPSATNPYYMDQQGNMCYYDKDGNLIRVDPQGNIITSSPNRHVYYLDNQGNRYYIDQHGNAIYTDNNGYIENNQYPYSYPQSNPYSYPQSDPYSYPQSDPSSYPQSDPYSYPQSDPSSYPQSNPIPSGIFTEKEIRKQKTKEQHTKYCEKNKEKNKEKIKERLKIYRETHKESINKTKRERSRRIREEKREKDKEG